MLIDNDKEGDGEPMRFLRRSSFILMLLLFALVTACQSNDADKPPDGPGGFLWKVEHGDTRVYLQGTIHIGEEDFYPLDYRIEEAFEASDVVLPEIDLNNQDMMQIAEQTMQLATYDDGTTLKDHIPADLYEETVAVFEELKLPVELFGIYKPWFIQTMLTESYTQEAGFNFELGIDQHLLERAAEDEKEVRELESFEEQMNLLAGFSDEIQIKLLEETLENREHIAEETQELVSLWKKGNVKGMLDLLAADHEQMSAEYESYMKALNDERNIKMTDKIMDILEEDSGKTYFVMVGAMHMIAKPSIISILEDNKYEVNHIY